MRRSLRVFGSIFMSALNIAEKLIGNRFRRVGTHAKENKKASYQTRYKN